MSVTRIDACGWMVSMIRRMGNTMKAKLSLDHLRMYEAGAPVRAVAKAAGLCYGTTYRALIESGIRLRSRGRECHTGWSETSPPTSSGDLL